MLNISQNQTLAPKGLRQPLHEAVPHPKGVITEHFEPNTKTTSFYSEFLVRVDVTVSDNIMSR